MNVLYFWVTRSTWSHNGSVGRGAESRHRYWKAIYGRGKNVRYIRTTFVPGEAHCMCLFEADNPDLVREVNEAAQIPFTRIVEALDLTPAK